MGVYICIPNRTGKKKNNKQILTGSTCEHGDICAREVKGKEIKRLRDQNWRRGRAEKRNGWYSQNERKRKTLVTANSQCQWTVYLSHCFSPHRQTNMQLPYPTITHVSLSLCVCNLVSLSFIVKQIYNHPSTARKCWQSHCVSLLLLTVYFVYAFSPETPILDFGKAMAFFCLSLYRWWWMSFVFFESDCHLENTY